MYNRFPSLLQNIGASVSYDSDAEAFFTTAGITDTTQKNAVNQLVLDLKSASIWTKMFAVYPFVGGTSSTHSYNLKNTAQYQITWSGTVTHNSNGITGNGSNGTGNTGFSGNVGTNFTVSSGSYGAYIRSGFNTVHVFMGCVSNSVFFYNNGGAVYTNYGSVLLSTGAPTFTRLVAASHLSTTLTAYRDGGSVSSTTGTPTTSAASDFYVLSTGATNFTTANLAFAYMSEGLTSGEISSLNTAVNTFQTTLGRNV